jgi:hypothetical protein
LKSSERRGKEGKKFGRERKKLKADYWSELAGIHLISEGRRAGRQKRIKS